MKKYIVIYRNLSGEAVRSKQFDDFGEAMVDAVSTTTYFTLIKFRKNKGSKIIEESLPEYTMVTSKKYREITCK